MEGSGTGTHGSKAARPNSTSKATATQHAVRCLASRSVPARRNGASDHTKNPRPSNPPQSSPALPRPPADGQRVPIPPSAAHHQWRGTHGAISTVAASGLRLQMVQIAMHHILVYSDSLTWGIIPNTRRRLAFPDRWTGVLENSLNEDGPQARVIEDCLNGRRTVWDDPFKPGRDGRQGLAQCIEIHSPLSLVILMLGTNDFQFSHPYNNAWSAAQGIGTLITEIRGAPIEPGMPIPPILVVCPPPIEAPRGPIAAKFPGAAERSRGLAAACRDLAVSLGCHFFDAGSVTPASRVDGIHLDADQHLVLGRTLVPVVASILRDA